MRRRSPLGRLSDARETSPDHPTVKYRLRLYNLDTMRSLGQGAPWTRFSKPALSGDPSPPKIAGKPVFAGKGPLLTLDEPTYLARAPTQRGSHGRGTGGLHSETTKSTDISMLFGGEESALSEITAGCRCLAKSVNCFCKSPHSPFN